MLLWENVHRNGGLALALNPVLTMYSQGTQSVFCSMEGHFQNGIHGKLIVVEPPNTSHSLMVPIPYIKSCVCIVGKKLKT